MGGVVDHSSNVPDPVAMSSAEVEYNEGCIAFMAASHLRMLLAELEGVEEQDIEHIMRWFHYVRECIVSKKFIMQWIKHYFNLPTLEQKTILVPDMKCFWR
jgi:hypothetical protein